MEKKEAEFKKTYKAFIAYAVFGAFTTIVNMAVYGILYYYFGWNNTLSNVLAWIMAVIFAYLTNKVWVFESRSWKINVLRKEIAAFVTCRLAIGIMDLVIMYAAVDVMHWNAMIMKILSNILVILLNYVFSKLVIFKK